MVVRCKIVIYDDFNNVLIAERGKGKNTPKIWGLFGKEVKGKEDDERCITKAVDKDLKCTIFDLKAFKEIKISDDELLKVFTGTVKEYITTHKSINTVKWIGKKELNNYNFEDEDIHILNDFFDGR